MTKIKLLVMISVVVIRITSTMNKKFGGVASICPSWREILGGGQSRQITPITPQYTLHNHIFHFNNTSDTHNTSSLCHNCYSLLYPL